MSDRKIVIAIDGYSSCGKSTLAKSLAQKLGYIYIDSGAMYRAITLFALRNNFLSGRIPDKKAIIESIAAIDITFEFNSATGMNTTFMNGENIEEEIRKPEVSENVSPVSVISEVRQEMVSLQQQMGRNKGIVMDGRDIGTVVFPDAELKIFMTADPAIRAKRRHLELTGKGLDISMEEVAKNIETRDHIDQTREASPLRKAGDAIILDNSNLTTDQQLEWAYNKAISIIKPDDR
jgi:CMP/dCMP kinase